MRQSDAERKNMQLVENEPDGGASGFVLGARLALRGAAGVDQADLTAHRESEGHLGARCLRVPGGVSPNTGAGARADDQ